MTYSVAHPSHAPSVETSVGFLEKLFLGKSGAQVHLAAGPEWLSARFRAPAPATSARHSFSEVLLAIHLRGPGVSQYVERDHPAAREMFRDVVWGLGTPFKERDEVFDHFVEAVVERSKADRVQIARLRAALRGAAACALSPLAADAIELARRFASEDRVAVLRAINADPTGRVAQMIDVCPSVVSLAVSDYAFSGGMYPAPEVMGQIVRGERLREIVRSLVRRFAPNHATRAAQHWVIYAPAACPAYVLRDGFPDRFIVDDLPDDEAERVRWYELVSTAAQLGRQNLEDQQYVNGLQDFVSKHAIALEDFLNERWMRAALTLGIIAGVKFSRRSHPQVALARVSGYLNLFDRAKGGDPRAIAFSAAPLPAPGVKGLTGRYVGTGAALYAVGHSMRHCAADYIFDAVAGRRAFYDLRHLNERLTLCLKRTSAGWTFANLKGVCNSPPSAEAVDAVCTWLCGEGVKMFEDMEEAARA